jgi:hypothetical protein
MDNEGADMFFFICALAPNIAYCVFWLIKVRIELLKVLLKNNKFLLFKIFSCLLITQRDFESKYMKSRGKNYKIDDNHRHSDNSDRPRELNNKKYIENEN